MEVIEIIQKLGGFGGISFGTVMVLIVLGSYKRIWVWGYQLDKLQAESDSWKAMALRSTGLSETAVSIAKDTRSL